MRLFAALGLAVFTLSAADVSIERVFGPEVPTGPYKHPAALAPLSNGDLLLVYYGGGGEYEIDTSVFGSRLAKGTSSWSQPRVLAHDPFRSVGNGVAWEAPDGVLWLFYVVRFGDVWSTSRIACKISRDRGETWSDSHLLALEAGMMVRGRPIALSDGAYLLPIYKEVSEDRELVGPESTSLFLRYDPKTRKWSESTRIRSRLGNIQPTAVEVSPGHLLAFCRRGGGYDGQKDGWLVRSESRDGGRTWSVGQDSEFPNPNAAVDLQKLSNGHLMLVYNDSFAERTPLKAAFSRDGGKTFPDRRIIASGKNDYAYPMAVQTGDGRIHIIYTANRRSTIFHAVFRE